MLTRRIVPIALVSLALVAFAATTEAQSSADVAPPLPATGLDFAAVDGFWRITDVLRADKDPSPAEWKTFLDTPGERLARIVFGDVIREDLELAFKPSKRVLFDSLTKLTNDRATRLTHLVRAASLRPQLVAFRDSMARAAPVPEAVRTAARYLPPGATDRGDPPFVAVAIFRNDGYSLGPGVVVDLLNAYEANLVLFLAHEFHHTYLGRTEEAAVGRPNAGDGGGSAHDGALRGAIQAIRNEGIADLIDKPHPLTWSNPVRANYVRRYNMEYENTPATLEQLDSLLSAVADDPTQMESAGKRAREILWSNSHPNGGYVARTIYEQFGVDSLFPGVTNPAALLRTYAAAQKARGNPDPFSSKSWSVIESFERRYWTRRR